MTGICRIKSCHRPHISVARAGCGKTGDQVGMAGLGTGHQFQRGGFNGPQVIGAVPQVNQAQSENGHGWGQPAPNREGGEDRQRLAGGKDPLLKSRRRVTRAPGAQLVLDLTQLFHNQWFPKRNGFFANRNDTVRPQYWGKAQATGQWFQRYTGARP